MFDSCRDYKIKIVHKTMKITSKQNYFELKYLQNGYSFTEVICTGIIDDKEAVIKFIRKKYKDIELVQISKLNM